MPLTRSGHLVSTQLKFIEKGSRMAKRIQYIKTNQMMSVIQLHGSGGVLLVNTADTAAQ